MAITIFLRKLSFLIRLADLEERFGIDRTIISRILSYINYHIRDHCYYLLQIRRCITNLLKQQWCNAINRRGAPLHSCIGFIDGKNRPFCRPSKNQRMFYNGHKRFHCIKFQAVFIHDLSGLFVGINYDTTLLTNSNLLDSLQICLEPGFVIYGDPAYNIDDYFVTGFEGSNLTDEQQIFNSRMSKARVAVEWSFGTVVKLSKALQYAKDWRVYLEPVACYCNTH